MTINETDLNAAADRLVQRDVILCLSSVVAALADGWDRIQRNRIAEDDLATLADQAADLRSPVLDYEETVKGEGYEVRHDHLGFYVLSAEEAEHEDQGNASVGFDGRHHAQDIQGAAREWCEAEAVDAYEWEVYEHWAVSPWLAEKLAAEGERVDTDFAGLNVWGRTTTGQSISMDAVIRKIAADLLKAF